MKKNGIITLILSALILVSCSDVPYTTGKIGLSGARMALSQAPIRVDKITAELKNNKTGETKKEFRTVNEDGFSEDITWDELPPNEEYTLTVSAEGYTYSSSNPVFCVYKGTSTCSVVPGKLTYVTVVLKKALSWTNEDLGHSFNKEDNPIEIDGFKVERNLMCNSWYADNTGTFILANKTIENQKDLFNVYLGSEIVENFNLNIKDGFGWDSIGDGLITVTANINNKDYQIDYPITHKYALSEPNLSPANSTIDQNNPQMSFTVFPKDTGTRSIFTSEGVKKNINLSEISQIAYSFYTEGNPTQTRYISSGTVSLSTDDLKINSNGDHTVTVTAKQVIDSNYSQYFYYDENCTKMIEIPITVSSLD